MSSTLRSVGIVGAGLMGRGIAQALVSGGIEVRLFDANADARRAAIGSVCDMLQRSVSKGRMTVEAFAACKENLSAVEDLGQLNECNLIIEAIVEDIGAKKALFSKLDAQVNAGCILATNTSSLSVTEIASACGRPERVAGLHFFNPVPVIKLVEVIAGIRTDNQISEQLCKLVDSIGYQAIRVKDTPGFLVNHAGRPFTSEALRIVSESVAGYADIDHVMRDVAGFRMGPFELLDLIGLDTALAGMESVYRRFYEEPRHRPVPEVSSRVAAGLLGRKTSAGFYRYQDGERQQPDEPALTAKLPNAVYLGSLDELSRKAIAEICEPLDVRIEQERLSGSDGPSLIAPLGYDVTTTVVQLGLDPKRTVAVDTLLGLESRVTLMASPVTSKESRDEAAALFSKAGRKVTVIADSPGFIIQRMLACIINVASEIAQLGIAEPGDIDRAVQVALGYPFGPLKMGDQLGADHVVTILERLLAATSDPRYRPSLWLSRRSRLGVSLMTSNLIE
ncbi:3-hydroxyacyl-CoA dehydrogenase [Mesorhizobium sp.]|uniref:3-hydroxyacyl-CoA dehydrogenase n=1 Tax=Mesorhizobium sp. TaxID=1871066 RepID=UPI001227E788|nr:3-hydroxyacyl-CoA dehydrogenase [Mesorhizobium sp.]TIO65365.1 MAG: 3-hydroxyacyl-CoA dehydrogenase [Mesorhizobium sp.]